MLCVTEERRERGSEGTKGRREERKRGRVHIAPVSLVICCTALQLF